MNPHAPTLAWFRRHPQHALALGFGAGLSPRAPGTAGTVVGVLLYLPLAALPTALYGLVLALAIAVGVYVCGAASRALGTDDPPSVVWDEIVGYWATMLAAPSGAIWWGVGFLLFRLFDIVKPWPCNWLDRTWPGGIGIMADDLAAALYAGLILQGLAALQGRGLVI